MRRCTGDDFVGGRVGLSGLVLPVEFSQAGQDAVQAEPEVLVGVADVTQVYVHDSLPAVGVGFILLVGGSGAVGALAVDMIVAAAPPESAGAASGPLLQAAQEAFTEGMRLAAAAGTVLMAVIAVLAAIALRHLRPHTDDPAEIVVDEEASLRS